MQCVALNMDNNNTGSTGRGVHRCAGRPIVVAPLMRHRPPRDVRPRVKAAAAVLLRCHSRSRSVDEASFSLYWDVGAPRW
ncbi:hypothetical protein E2C01_096162 [Portunus trituberculatus]|uniref:Uncharacterized protein n=1 Tax=Portunus trituberculatus TaxID=210409 RepID=A0A5B7K227_PORTR|nr:hypothetical protein [Portunus trituberculatus]